MTKALEVEISAFLNQYDEAFTTFDGDQIAALYCIPTITVRGDGPESCTATRIPVWSCLVLINSSRGAASTEPIASTAFRSRFRTTCCN